MGKAARAIIIEDGRLLVMHRNKYGSQYYTLVGGQLGPDEHPETALVREIREETGLVVTHASLVFFEEHPEPYNQQFIYLCQVAPHADVAIQDYAEEAQMNRLAANTHRPLWIDARGFARLPFVTPQLHEAIIKALKNGFPQQPVRL